MHGRRELRRALSSVLQAEAQKEAVELGTESRLVASTAPVIQAPNLFASALGAFANSLSTGLDIKAAVGQSGTAAPPTQPSSQATSSSTVNPWFGFRF